MDLLVGNLMTVVGWVGLIVYWLAWLFKFRTYPKLHREGRAISLLPIATLLAAGGVLRWLGAEPLKLIIPSFAMSAFCLITWCELKGLLSARQ